MSSHRFRRIAAALAVVVAAGGCYVLLHRPDDAGGRAPARVAAAVLAAHQCLSADLSAQAGAQALGTGQYTDGWAQVTIVARRACTLRGPFRVQRPEGGGWAPVPVDAAFPWSVGRLALDGVPRSSGHLPDQSLPLDPSVVAEVELGFHRSPGACTSPRLRLVSADGVPLPSPVSLESWCGTPLGVGPLLVSARLRSVPWTWVEPSRDGRTLTVHHRSTCHGARASVTENVSEVVVSLVTEESVGPTSCPAKVQGDTQAARVRLASPLGSRRLVHGP